MSVLLLVFAASAVAGVAAPQQKEDSQLAAARRGLDLLMNGDPDAAMQVFKGVQEGDPDSPLGDLLMADAVWWKIYFASADLINPDVFDVVTTDTTKYDAQFNELVSAVIRKAQAKIAAGDDVPRNQLYLGMGYGLQARLAGLRGQDLGAARAGKRMRATLLAAVSKDPNLNDAYLGVGIYEYFVDTLPAIVKMLRWLVGLPGGDRLEGLKHIEQAANEGDLARGEAMFYLAKDYSRPFENQNQKSLELFQQLAKRYPQNGLWKILVASLEIQLGRKAEGEALYRQVLTDTAGASSESGRAFHHAAEKALNDQHPH